MIHAFLCWASLALGNFIYQALMAGDWNRAFERSFFQAFAIFCLIVSQRSTSKQPPTHKR
jgi:hypothetical protein